MRRRLGILAGLLVILLLAASPLAARWPTDRPPAPMHVRSPAPRDSPPPTPPPATALADAGSVATFEDLRCTVQLPSFHEPLVARARDLSNPVWQVFELPVTVEPGALTLPADFPSGNAEIKLPGLETLTVSWKLTPSGRQCTVSSANPLPLDSWIEGTVVDGFGAPIGARLEGCGFNPYDDTHVIEADGRFGFPTVARSCTLRAYRFDGDRRVYGEAVDVWPRPQGEAVVRLQMPSDARAVLGWVLAGRASSEGAEVLQVHPDSPALASGLQVGDVVTSIAGIDLAGRAVAEISLEDLLHDEVNVALSVLDVDGDVRQVSVQAP